MNLLKPLTPSLLALALAACAVGPDYKAPATEPAKLDSGLEAKAFDRSLPDEIVQVTDAEAFEMTRRLAAEEGLLVGGSAGMAVVSAITYAREHDLDANQTVVVLLPDSGRSYMEKIFNDDWMRANGFGDVVDRTTKPSLAEQYL